MDKFKLVLAAALLTSLGSFANAEMLTLKPGPNSINGVNVSTSATATLKMDNKTTSNFDLTTVGAGLRNKQVIFNIPVYVAQMMMSDSARFVKSANGALPSIDNETSVAIRMSFLRDVDAQTVATSFQDSFDANKISARDPDVVQFMNVVNKNGDVKSGGTLTIFITKNADGSETLAYENLKPGTDVQPAVIQVGKDMAHKIMSIWLGNPADSGLADLKAALLK